MTKKQYLLLVIIILGLVTRFAFFGHPNEVVFDEVHFGGFVSGYYSGNYFFDIHPPLGKIVIAGFAKIFDFKPELSFAKIGEKYPNESYKILRFLPSLAGALLPLVIFLLLLEFGLKNKMAFFGSALVALENAILAQSRFILLDSFLLLFGFSALLFYFIYTRTHKFKYLALACILAASAMSVKWTGASFLALILMVEGIKFLKYRAWRTLPKLALYLAVTPFVVYFSFFVLHFSLLHKSGPGDAFMSPGFRMTLEGSSDYDPENPERLNVFQKFIQLNSEMYLSNQRLTATHPYSSPWYTWPLMVRSIFYWVNDNSRIYLIGNPLVWWASTFAVVYTLISMINRWSFKNEDKPLLFMMGAYWFNMLPFIGVQRVMFIYHYFIALIFAIMILAYLADKKIKNNIWLFGFLAIVLLTFVYFAPLNYGLPLEFESFKNRMWFGTWE